MITNEVYSILSIFNLKYYETYFPDKVSGSRWLSAKSNLLRLSRALACLTTEIV